MFLLLSRKFIQVSKVTHEKSKISRTSIDSITATSDLLIFAIFLGLRPLSYYMHTNDSGWVAITLIFIFSIDVRAKSIRWSFAYKINEPHPKTCKTLLCDCQISKTTLKVVYLSQI